MKNDLQEIKSFVDELDQLIPKDNILIELDGWDDSPELISTKEGLLRLGVDLLKGAYLDENIKKSSGINYVDGFDYFPHFDIFLRDESIHKTNKKEKRTDLITGVFIASFIVAVVLIISIPFFYGLYDLLIGAFY